MLFVHPVSSCMDMKFYIQKNKLSRKVRAGMCSTRALVYMAATVIMYVPE